MSPNLSVLTNLGALSTTGFAHAPAAGAPLLPPREFSYAATLNADLDAVVDALRTNKNAKMLQRPRMQTSVGMPVQIYVGWEWPTGFYCGAGSHYGRMPRGFPRTGETLGVTFKLIGSIPADGLVLEGIQQQAEICAGNTEITGVGSVPIVTNRASLVKVVLGEGQTVLLGGFIEASKARIFSEIDQLSRFPPIGNLINRVITYPKRTKYAELVVVIKSTLLLSPRAPAWLTNSSCSSLYKSEPAGTHIGQ